MSALETAVANFLAFSCEEWRAHDGDAVSFPITRDVAALYAASDDTAVTFSRVKSQGRVGLTVCYGEFVTSGVAPAETAWGLALELVEFFRRSENA